LIGQPIHHEIDVVKALRDGKQVDVSIFSGTSVLQPGSDTVLVDSIERILSPLAQSEVGSNRCMGLNVSSCLRILRPTLLSFAKTTLQYKQRAEEVRMPLPSVPTVFM
jgi:hypothetical protein